MIQEEHIDEDVYRPTTSATPDEAVKSPKDRNIHAVRAEKVREADVRVQIDRTAFTGTVCVSRPRSGTGG